LGEKAFGVLCRASRRRSGREVKWCRVDALLQRPEAAPDFSPFLCSRP
jgi:hypothetical protein